MSLEFFSFVDEILMYYWNLGYILFIYWFFFANTQLDEIFDVCIKHPSQILRLQLMEYLKMVFATL